MRFGTKKSEAPEEFDNDGLYLRNFKDGEQKVRFLQETDDWIEFREHYTSDRRSFPCTRDKDTCPGCTSDDEDVQRSSRKYATNVHVVKGNYVAPHRIPISLAKRMFARAERNDGTITNRDYIVMRSGKGLETDYDVEADDKYEVNIKALLKDGKDIEEILAKSFEENAPGQAAKPAKASRFEKDDEGDEVVPRSARRVVKDDEDEIPSETKSSAAEDDDLVLDEDALIDMTIPELKAIAAKAEVDIPAGAKKSTIIRLLLDEAGV
jgi:hypothetical protein